MWHRRCSRDGRASCARGAARISMVCLLGLISSRENVVSGEIFLTPCFSEPVEDLHLEVGELESIASLEFQEARSAWRNNNLVHAIAHYRRSAQKGYEVGEYCFKWGQYHELAPADKQQAMRWYKRGARLNHLGCITALGKVRFALGLHNQATSWLMLAAKPEANGSDSAGDGDSLAQWYLAELRLKQGRWRDAVRWWLRSAAGGDHDAMMRLSEVFAIGSGGIPLEPARSRYWQLRAAASEHPRAVQEVDWKEKNRPRAESGLVEGMRKKGWI
eukprot:TRINITY_DN12825_c0_g3_i1.p2 TRINITY_DN12825_c0_g3~~TRINITY_DN12825_c0_g3_i1.p2  ORF type:complete len:274 (+),score=45.13 TRINITY_DN12825_c0_g3_i1:108-929(+)